MHAFLAMLGLSTRAPRSRPGVSFQFALEEGVAVVGALACGPRGGRSKNRKL